MKEKIKNFFAFIKSGWMAGYRGKIGVGLIILSLFFFVRLFCGSQATLQGFIINSWNLKQEKQLLELKTKELQTLKKHQELVSDKSPDYIEELGLKYQFGDAEFKELKY